MHEVVHIISKGESISLIANAYRKRGWAAPGWEPIWRLNTVVYSNLRNRADPDKIFPGDTLMIPRSPAGYDRLVAKLSELKSELLHMHMANQASLGAIRDNVSAYSNKVDLASTILTLIPGLVIKGASIVKLARDAKTLSGAPLAASKYLMKAEALKMAKDVGWVAAEELAGKIHPVAGVAVKGANTVGKVRMITSVLDVAEIICDWTSPSTIAKAITGYEKSMKEQERNAEFSKAKALAGLDDKINRITAERRSIYA